MSLPTLDGVDLLGEFCQLVADFVEHLACLFHLAVNSISFEGYFLTGIGKCAYT